MSSPFMPTPPPASTPPGCGTQPICLGNYLPRITKFKICGSQGGTVQTVEVTVKPYSYQWSQGWDAGPNQIVTVSVGPAFSKTFCKFMAPANVALFHK